MLFRNTPLCLGVALLVLCLSAPLMGQEGCNLPSTVASLLPNPSLEQFSAGQEGCASRQPNGLPDNTNQANCLVGWQRVSLGTTDAWNAFTLPSAGPGFPSQLPQPLPSGTSVAGFWVGIRDTDGNQFRNGNRTWAKGYREYLAACFEPGKEIEAGLDYRLTFHLGFAERETYKFLGRKIDLASPSGVELAIYGVKECGQLDFGSFYGCPEEAEAEGYELIANVTVDGEPGSWTFTSVDFVAAGDYAGFAIGGSCGSDITREDGKYYRNYYFIDDIILNRREAFDQPVAGPVSVEGQSMCTDEIVLRGQPAAGASYQWLHNGTEVPGGNSPTLALEQSDDLDGTYALRIATEAGCAITEEVLIQRPVIGDLFPDSIALCPGGGATIFPTHQVTGTFKWSDGSKYSYLPVSKPGTYSVTINSACLEQVETFEVVETPDISYTFRMSPEKPCPGDTVDVWLETDWYAPLVMYTVSDEETHYVSGSAPIRVVAGEVSTISTLLISSCNMYSDEIEVPALPRFKPEALITDLNCQGPTGSIQLTTNGSVPDQYAWSGPEGDLPPSTESRLPVNVPGTYTVTLTGSANCATSVSYAVEDRQFSLDILTTDAACGADGSASALASGGTPPYAIQWRGAADQPPMAQGTTVLADLPRGTYVTQVSDQNGCFTSQDFTIDGPEPMQASAELVLEGCSPAITADLEIEVTGGVAPYTYAIAGAAEQTTPRLSGLEAGRYTVQVYDALNCAAPPVETEVTLPEPVSVELVADRRITYGESMLLELAVQGSNPDEALIFWDSNAELEFPDGLLRAVSTPENTAWYSVEYITPDDCVYTDSLLVNVDNTVRAYVPTAFSPNGDGTNDLLELYPNVGVTGVENFRVFDRWGGLVWETSEEQVAWDGTQLGGQPLSTGTYFYHGQLRLLRGGTTQVKGTVLLTR
ncbi:T9SS type B sorting domain-containing protein [Neolewinella litorea]|uniref:T9SS type B sorting domain-containing protein n=1 Tax=Neolewinella litorea TaxID=2562452 RepID=A0A4S4NFV4_9BACT|nr:gliding motility-associated C-terminal domain-containing protein [Neolewinella litorea]THH34950.1 T9SS type B sorting domain-containing protein [Neolewinella litorea]